MFGKLKKLKAKAEAAAHKLADQVHGHVGTPGTVDEICERLAKKFETGEEEYMTVLDMRGKELGNAAVEKFAAALRKNTTVSEINLQGNHITDEGVDHLCLALNDRKVLTKLDMYNNDLTGVGAAKLIRATANTSLKWLDVGKNSICENDGKDVVEAAKLHPGLTFLQTGLNKMSDGQRNDIAAVIRQNTEDWDAAQKRARNLRLAANDETLVALECDHEQFTPTQIAELADALTNNMYVQKIDLTKCRLGDDAIIRLAQALPSLGALTWLNLKCNKLTERGAVVACQAAARIETLKWFELWHNTIGVEGVKAAAEALKLSSSIVFLNLRGCELGDEGVKALCESGALKPDTELALQENNITPVGVALLAEEIKKGNIDDLSLAHQEGVGDEGAKLLADALVHLANTEEGGVKTGIKRLSLNECKIGVHGAIALGKALGAYQGLNEFNIYGNAILDHGAQGLAKGIRANKTIKKLCVRGCQYFTTAILEAVTNHPSVTYLNTDTIKFGEAGVAALGALLSSDTPLKTLSINQCELTDAHAKAIGDALAENKHLQTLFAFTNNITNADAIAHALTEKNKTLRKLELTNCQITSESAEELAKALLTNRSLQHLELSMNKIGHNARYLFSRALVDNNELKVLGFGGDLCGSGGGLEKSMAKALMKNKTLEILALDYGSLGFPDNSAILNEFAPALRVNSSLKQLQIYTRAKGDVPQYKPQATLAMATALRTNKTLQALQIKLSYQGEEHQKAASELVEACSVGRAIDMLNTHVKLDDDSKAMLKRIEFTNKQSARDDAAAKEAQNRRLAKELAAEAERAEAAEKAAAKAAGEAAAQAAADAKAASEAAEKASRPVGMPMPGSPPQMVAAWIDSLFVQHKYGNMFLNAEIGWDMLVQCTEYDLICIGMGEVPGKPRRLHRNKILVAIAGLIANHNAIMGSSICQNLKCGCMVPYGAVQCGNCGMMVFSGRAAM